MSRSFFRQIVLSFSSGEFYRSVTPQLISKSVRYLILLIVAASVVLSVRYAFLVSQALGELEVWAWKHLPEIRIEKGEVQTPVQPWRYQANRQFIAILDATGQTKEIPPEFSQGLLLTRNQLVLRRPFFESQRYDLAGIDHFRLNAQIIQQWKQKGVWFLWPLLFASFFGYFLVEKLSQVVLFSAFSLMTCWVSGRVLSYRSLLNIGIYAMTLPFLLAAGLLLFGPPPPSFDLFFVAIYGALLVAAVLHGAPLREAAPGIDR